MVFPYHRNTYTHNTVDSFYGNDVVKETSLFVIALLHHSPFCCDSSNHNSNNNSKFLLLVNSLNSSYINLDDLELMVFLLLVTQSIVLLQYLGRRKNVDFLSCLPMSNVSYFCTSSRVDCLQNMYSQPDNWTPKIHFQICHDIDYYSEWNWTCYGERIFLTFFSEGSTIQYIVRKKELFHSIRPIT